MPNSPAPISNFPVMAVTSQLSVLEDVLVIGIGMSICKQIPEMDIPSRGRDCRELSFFHFVHFSLSSFKISLVFFWLTLDMVSINTPSSYHFVKSGDIRGSMPSYGLDLEDLIRWVFMHPNSVKYCSIFPEEVFPMDMA